MSDKRLTISLDAKIDPKVQQMGKVMNDLVATREKLGKGPGGGKGGPGADDYLKMGSLAKAMLANKKVIDDYGKSGERLSKILTDQVGKSNTALTKSLEESTRKLDPLMKKYESAIAHVERLKQMSPSNLAAIDRYSSHANRLGSDVMSTVLAKQQAQAALDSLNEGPGSGGGQGGLSLMASMASALGLPGAGLFGAMGGGGAMGAMGAAGAIGAVLMTAKRMYQQHLEGGVALGAEVGGLASSQYGLATSNDSTWGLGLGRMARDRGFNQDVQSAARMSGVFSSIGAGVSNIGELLVGNGGEWWNRISKSYDASSTAKRIAMVQQAGAEEGPMGSMMDNAKALVNANIASERRFGLGAWNRAGAMATGVGGLTREDLLGYAGNLAGSVGARSALGYAGGVAGAVAGGWDAGTAASVIGGTAVGGGGVMGAVSRFDPTMGGILGQNVAGRMGARSMMFEGSGYGLADALAGAVDLGVGGPAGVRQAQQAAMGMDMWGGVMGGHSGYQKSYNMAAAAAAMPGGSSYQMNFLATQMADPKVLAAVMRGGGKVAPEDFARMGISASSAFATAKDVSSGFLGRWYDQGDDSPGARRMREVRKMGGDFGKYLGGMGGGERRNAINDMAPLLAQMDMDLFGGDVGAAQGFLSAAGGLTTPGSARAARMGKGGGRGGITDEERSMQDKLELSKVNEALRQQTQATVDNTAAVRESITSGRTMTQGAAGQQRNALNDWLTNHPGNSRPAGSPSGPLSGLK